VRRVEGFDVFDPSLVLARWAKENFLRTQPAFCHPTRNALQTREGDLTLELHALEPPQVVSVDDKRKIASVVCLKLASALSWLPTEFFKEQLKEVEVMDRLLSDLKRCKVVEIGTSCVPSS
jgi:hypothetical protein